MNVAIAQINTTVGDLAGNTRKIISYINKARKKDADLVVFPELAITGYPPKDLLLKKKFIKENKAMLREIVKKTKGIAVILGFVDYAESKGETYDAVAIIKDRKLLFVQHKISLPNYDVFDEKRYFTPGRCEDQKLFPLKGKKIGVLICEDLWIKEPSDCLKKKGADVIIAISSSPFHVGKMELRKRLIEERAKANNTALFYVNSVGGQDDLVFDGRSLVADRKGRILLRCRSFEEDLFVVDIDTAREIKWHRCEPLKETFEAMLLGLSDYVHKNHFKKVIVGISGGIDSALTATLATIALGSDNVVGVMMPSKFTSLRSVKDAKKIARNLGIKLLSIPIDNAMLSYERLLRQVFKGKCNDVTEENIQARIRGNILMALSNKFGWLVLSTGNKSEMATGYCTLYGDLTGGLSVLSDVLKTTVYKLSRHINDVYGAELIPESIINKEPTAELKRGQKDKDTLPPYNVLDKILHYYIDCLHSKEQIVAKGFSKTMVNRVVHMVDMAEYKRRQAPIGIKITPTAFGSGRRMPITNWWKE